uniref:Ankyrin repeat protein n=1 Tax=Pithovirus LCPAC304 TaxID=2506594 RepID=A0A481Z8A2_9VIRU|nr:MAG: ankyrin repeat protein [Pithovirus LCPAC304]
MEAESHLSGDTRARLDRILEENPTVDMLKELPSEMQMYVAVQMRYPDVVRFCATSTEAKRVCNTDYFWKLKMEHDFPKKAVGPEGKRRETYKKYWQDAQEKLVECAKRGHAECIESSIQLGIDLNFQDETRRTALYLASSRGHTDIVRVLLDHDANPDLQDWKQDSVLITASWLGHADIVKLLLDHDADSDHQDMFGNTALMEASRKGYVNIVRLLLEQGAVSNLQNSDGKTALDLASEMGYTDIVELLSSTS